ncbi:MAG: pitrilysin family protein [Actinomycetota bacterium]
MMATSTLVAKRPTNGAPKDWDFPGFTRTRLDNGFQVMSAHAPGRYMGTAKLIIEAGASNEEGDQGGVAYLAARALTEGTGRHKGGTFVQAVERLGAVIFASCGYDSFTVELHVPLDRMEPALDLLAEAVLDPEFSGKDIDRLKLERMGGIMQEYSQPTSRAEIAFRKSIYSEDSLYARSPMGDYASVMNLAKGKVRKYYERFATPPASTLVVSGDLDGFPLVKIAEKLFGRWKGKEPERSTGHNADAVKRSFVLLVHREEAEQSQIEIGHVGVPRSNPDFFPLLLMNGALGGTIDSRLSRKLREEKGFTYGVRSGFVQRRQAGPFHVTTAVDTKVTTEAIGEAIEVIRSASADGFTQAELDIVKGFYVGIFPLQFETPDAIADGLGTLVTHRLPDDYWATYRHNVESVTLDQVNEAASKYLRPDHLAIVAVGDADEVKDGLLEANFGPVAVIEDPEAGQPPIH